MISIWKYFYEFQLWANEKYEKKNLICWKKEKKKTMTMIRHGH